MFKSSNAGKATKSSDARKVIESIRSANGLAPRSERLKADPDYIELQRSNENLKIISSEALER